MNNIKFIKVNGKPFCFKDESIFQLACYLSSVSKDESCLRRSVSGIVFYCGGNRYDGNYSLVVSRDKKILMNGVKSKDIAQLYRLAADVINNQKKYDY